MFFFFFFLKNDSQTRAKQSWGQQILARIPELHVTGSIFAEDLDSDQ